MDVLYLITYIILLVAFYGLLSVLFCGIPVMLLSYEKIGNGLSIPKNTFGMALLFLILIFFMSLGINVFTIFNLFVFGTTFYFIPKWLIKTNLHTKVLPATGIIIVLASLFFYLLWILITIQSESGSYALNVLQELSVITWYEAFYKFYLPYFFRISALFVYGLINLSLWNVLTKGLSKRNIKIFQLELLLFFFFVLIELLHAYLYGRRMMI